MTDREMALQAVGDAAVDCMLRLERIKGWLDHLTPEEAQAWFRARQECDRLYAAVNRAAG